MCFLFFYPFFLGGRESLLNSYFLLHQHIYQHEILQQAPISSFKYPFLLLMSSSFSCFFFFFYKMRRIIKLLSLPVLFYLLLNLFIKSKILFHIYKQKLKTTREMMRLHFYLFFVGLVISISKKKRNLLTRWGYIIFFLYALKKKTPTTQASVSKTHFSK